MQRDIITAIDFGSKKLSGTVAIKEKEELEILCVKSSKSAGIEKGLITDINKCREPVMELLKDLEEKSKKDITSITIGISSSKVRITETSSVIDLKEDKVTSEEIKKAIRKGQKQITISSDECVIDILINFYILDGKIIHKDVLNWKGRKLELNLTIVIGKKVEIEKYYEVFKGSKYNIESIKNNILVGKQIFLNEKNSLGEIVLADIGAGIVDIVIFNNGIPKYIDNLQVGGNNITNDLAICGGFSFLEADNMKKIYSSNYRGLYDDVTIPDQIEVGTVKVSRKLFYEVTNARIEEILSHINMKLKNTGHYDRICSIILYGDAISYFEDINETVQKIFKVKTKIIKKADLGINNSENITSLAIAKEVYDRIILLEDNNIIQTNRISENIKNSEIENSNSNEDENTIIRKVKGFFDKLF